MRVLQVAAGAVALTFGGAASAQNMQLTEAPTIHDAVSAQWMVDLFEGGNFDVEVVNDTSDHVMLQMTAPNGAAFYTLLRACDEGAPKKCSLLENVAFFDAAGVTLGQINALVRDKFALSYAFLGDDGEGAIASKVVLVGGVTESNIINEYDGFFHDVDAFIGAVQSGALATVDFDTDYERFGSVRTKIDNFDGGEFIVNAVGPNAPNFLTDDFQLQSD